MTKEELIELKGRISKLNDSEKKRILNELNNGKEYDFNSGYATIDRPWQRNFNMDEFYKIKNDKNVYQDIIDENIGYDTGIAIEYFLKKVPYKELFTNINKTAKSLEEYGIKKGDFVTVCCAGIPELVYSFYALAKIGAVANMMAPYFEHDQMVQRICDCESDTLIVMDKFYPHIKDAIKKSSIKKVIVIPTLNSSPLRFIPSKKLNLDYSNELFWNQFIKDGKKRGESQTVAYEKNYPLCMVYSSGTTGASKAILLSNDSFQNSVLSYRANNIDMYRGQKMYQIIPPWYSTGLNSSIHLALHHGLTVFQDPRFERKPFVDNIIKYNINYAIAPTSMYEGFLEDDIVKNRKIKNLEYPIEGGEPLTAEVKNQIESKLKEHGCESEITAGYGQCECGATVTSPSQNAKHHPGSVALPLPGIIVSIFDDDNNELKYNQRGNIYVSTPCGMLEYYKNPEATQEYFYIDEYGRKWSKTGDIGYIVENGDLFIEGRASDFVMVNNNKVYNFDVEAVVMKMPEISNCDSIKKCDDEFEEIGLHLIFKDEYKDKYFNKEELLLFLNKIQRSIFEKYNSIDMVPKYFKIRDNFPYKPSGKRDIEKLSSEKDGFIFVDNSYLIAKKLLKERI